ncbi:hypothetical protein SAG0128_08615 [Streptococcus agalactiae STIR-CD-24]|nr:hypothetical protein SAG0125_08605 [Streptococcus agalactiae STIR-CD-21]EPU14930.1 hypothetical protein SAG0128_08615 [Streptococcus agalactiae STIR-CD-24]EPV01192.1 hypothetical protein SAG0325_04695 [Streptococcus agalactiae GB00535]EPV14793.1 hypothetical protein SAG0331_08135 [Streptococcus agalactiae GB00588]EPV50058.1 hypothetical protein SAG0355_04295 [Streptococcus agalactiae GB00909]EPX26900.1 hypothetical protein SAG0215_06390 [Streptococcus agalactiae str. Gottschalk 998A]
MKEIPCKKKRKGLFWSMMTKEITLVKKNGF